MLPMNKLAKNVLRNRFIFCERIFFLNCINFWTQYYPMNSLTHNVLQCRHQPHRQKPLGMLSFHWKSTKIVLIRENMEQFIWSNVRSAPAYGVNISQLIRYSRACGYYQDFLDRGFVLTPKLLKQGGTRLLGPRDRLRHLSKLRV
jgi:hypothetical protein